MKKTLRLTAVLMCMVLLVASLAACSKTQQTQATPTESQEEKLKVAMVCSMGGLGDRSYNDSGYVGLQKGEKYLTELAQAGYNLVMTLEYGHADILKKVAPQFPETRFAIFNIEVDEPNVTSVVFKEHEGSYLAGALAALVTKDANIKETNPEKVLGFIGGIQSPGIDKFLVGFEEGAKYIDKDTKVISGYANSFGDPAKGKEMALVQMEQGADIVYQVAGGTGEGVINAAKDKGCFAIGVDSDQDYIAPGNVLTSMMKRVDVAVFELSKQLKDGSIKNSNTMILGLKEDGVGLSPMEYTKDLIPKEYFDQVEQLKKAIVDGEIKVTDITQN